MVQGSCKLILDCPAKINLSLAILGRRGDGFHRLHSVVAQTRFGDQMELVWNPAAQEEDQVTITGSDLSPKDNTVTKAIKLFRESSGISSGQFKVALDKRIPTGAGLGGGSSNAAAILRGLGQLFPEAAQSINFTELASLVGSDCPLFLEDKPVIMEGRGEIIRPLDKVLISRLAGKPVILFKPSFSINTAEAYQRLAKLQLYHTMEAVEENYQAWLNGNETIPAPLNDFERLLGQWMPSLPIVLNRLRSLHGLPARLSGSGSACFVFPNDITFARNVVQEELKAAWGNAFWMYQTVVN